MRHISEFLKKYENLEDKRLLSEKIRDKILNPLTREEATVEFEQLLNNLMK